MNCGKFCGSFFLVSFYWWNSDEDKYRNGRSIFMLYNSKNYYYIKNYTMVYNYFMSLLAAVKTIARGAVDDQMHYRPKWQVPSGRPQHRER